MFLTIKNEKETYFMDAIFTIPYGEYAVADRLSKETQIQGKLVFYN